MSDHTTVPDPADAQDMTPEAYAEDVRERYFLRPGDEHPIYAEHEARVQKLQAEARSARQEAEDLSAEAEARRAEAKAAAKSGEEDPDPLFEEAERLAEKAERSRAIAEAKEEAASEAADDLQAVKRTVGADREGPFQKERRQRLRELREAYDRFAEALAKARAIDDVGGGRSARLERPGRKVLEDLTLTVDGTWGEKGFGEALEEAEAEAGLRQPA